VDTVAHWMGITGTTIGARIRIVLRGIILHKKRAAIRQLLTE